jgi:hypothetical protein
MNTAARWIHPGSVVRLLLACATFAACKETTALPTEPPSVILSTAASSLALAQGDRGAVDVTIARNGGFIGPVTLAVSGAPAGAAVDLGVNPVTGSSASFTISIGDATTPGTYPLTLTASGDGIGAEKLSLELQVAERMPVSIAVRYCTGLEPFWVAFQDGNGTWTQALPSVGGGMTTFSSAFSTNRGAIATLVRVSAGFTALGVQYGTPTELTAVGDTNPDDCGGSGVTKTLQGTVAGLGTNEFALINTGFGSRARVRLDVGNSFELHALPTGPQDLLATRTTQTTEGDALTRMIVRRNLDLPDGATLPVLDFASAEAFAPAVANVTFGGLGTEGASGSSSLLTSHGTLGVTLVTSPVTTVTRQYVALPEAQLLPGDLQVLFATANPPTGGDGRTATLYFRAPTDRTLTLGAPLIHPTFTTIATEPALRLRAQFAAQDDYDRSAGVSFQGATTTVSVSMTSAYAALTEDGYDLVVPDLSHAAGFDPGWALRPGGSLLWVAGRLGGTLGLGRNAVPSDGATQRSTAGFGTIAP